jgi:hypothetical protein
MLCIFICRYYTGYIATILADSIHFILKQIFLVQGSLCTYIWESHTMALFWFTVITTQLNGCWPLLNKGKQNK